MPALTTWPLSSRSTTCGRAAVFVFIALAATVTATPAPWRSVLYQETGYEPAVVNLETDKVLQDFSYAGYRRGEVPIPEVAGPVFDVTVAPYFADPTGTNDATSAIQAAINAAGGAGGGVVWLPAGTYRLSVPVDRNEGLFIGQPGVVLRGAGREVTRLINTTYAPMRGKAVIRVRGPSQVRFLGEGTHEVALSADVLTSTRTIPVVSTAPFAVGDTVVVRNTLGDAWITEHGEPDWLGQGHLLGGLSYRRTVTAVDAAAGTLTVDAPVRYALKQRDDARVVRLASAPLKEVGLEDFSFANVQHPGDTWAEGDHAVEGTAAHDVHGSFFIMIERAQDIWVRRLATYQPVANTTTAHLISGGVNVRESTHVTIEDCVFQRPQYGGGGGNGYLFRLIHTGESLVQRCEARFSRHGFMVSGIGASGNVFHDCLDAETGRATGASGSYVTSGNASDHHMHFSQANLFDVCTAEDSWFEARYRPFAGPPRHNLTAVHSVFWNTEGTGTRGGAVVRSEQARYGYVIGTRGPRSAVLLPRVSPGGTDPIDHLEGEGQGTTLVPTSLFLDQRLRRLGPRVLLPDVPVLPFPANTATVQPLGFTLGGEPVAAETLEVSWSGPGGVRLEPLAGGGVRAQVPGPGQWLLVVTSSHGEFSHQQTVLVRVAASVESEPRVLIAVADTYIEGGTPADTNYGANLTFRLKRAAGPSTTRHGLLRFDLSALGGDLPLEARLVLHSQRALSSYPGWQVAVQALASDHWQENTVTWNNAPAFGLVAATFAPSATRRDEVDVTPLLLQAWEQGQTSLGLGLTITTQPDSTLLYYHSREQSDGALRPRLELDVIPAASRYSEWIQGFPGLNEDQREPDADPDGDGVANLLEMVLGGDPTQADATGVGWRWAAEGTGWTVTLVEPGPAFLNLVVERSEDLMTWQVEAIPPERVTTGPEGRVLDIPLLPDLARAFWRLRAWLQP